jgi:hypothetical protein
MRIGWRLQTVALQQSVGFWTLQEQGVQQVGVRLDIDSR